ncbi:MAG: monovalent cation/hydrogen antiporter [Pseudomonadota bacterium]|nr:monovalent cation/hydrogen antiporter [Pseudomonadota bacterium]MDQ5915248.1 monovalent cation/hydrogen antiporter [Pseudomonadota bacterium]MDQ5917055.1 monovalent cation/hydrogen antiporter [Pseudomonadota bacterium]MDQ5945617.1 monovalent cation/hydrogen antiporter [Pseudomonadota bacterium]
MLLLELVLLLMICAVALGWLARHFKFPYPIALVVGGALLGLIPKLPQFPFDPQLILVIVLPPILYQASLLTSWSDFKANIRPISLLAIGLVVATTLAVGLALKLMVPSVPWAAAFVLGAIISPPDAVAATTILSRLNMPRHIVTILEGESLVNDASGLVIYKLAIVAVLTGAFSFAEASAQFALVSVGGVLIGIVLAFVFIAIHRRLGDPFIEVITALIVPYTVYIAAESLHVSGVLAVVAAGLVRGRYSPEIVSAEMRIMARSVWNVLVFMLNSLIFILIGIQMSDVMDNLGRYPLSELLLLGTLISVVAIAVRFLWVFPVAYLPRWLSGNLHEQAPKLRRRELTIISWCGMRGIVSLAAALALPVVMPNGEPFPARDLIIFLTFFVIATTLVGQGLSLTPLIRKLKVGSDWSMAKEQQLVYSAMSSAALAAIDSHLVNTQLLPERVDRLRSEIAGQTVQLASDGQESALKDDLLQFRRIVIKAKRAELIRLWRENEISDEVMRHQEEVLDYQEAQL